MAKKLNKSLVGTLILTLMVLLAAVGFVLVQNLPGSDPKVFAEDAKRLEAAEEFEAAMNTYRRAYLKDDTKNPEYLVSAARCAIEAGELSNARSFLGQALIDDPAYAAAHTAQLKLELELAKLYGGNNLWQRVLDCANAAAAQSSLSEQAITNGAQGLAMLALSDTDSSYREKGLARLRRAFEIDPKEADTIQILTRELLRSAKEKEFKGNVDDARTDMETAYSMIDSAIAKARQDGTEKELAELEFTRAQLLLMDDKTEESAAIFERLGESTVLETRPLIALAGIYMGQFTTDADVDLERAKGYLKKALELDPGSGNAYLTLGAIYESQNAEVEDPDVKREYRQKLQDLYSEGLSRIKRTNHFRDRINNEARVLMVRGLFLLDINDARSTNDKTASAKSIESAEGWLDQMKEEVSANSEIVLFLETHLLYAQGEILQATRQGEAAMKAAGSRPNVQLLRLMSDLYSRQSQWGRVEEMIEKAINATPRNPDPALFVRMGQVLLQQDRTAEALRYLKPDSPERLRNAMLENRLASELRLSAYLKLGRTAEAEDENRRLGTTASIDDRVRNILMMVSQKEFDDAEQGARELFEANPDNLKVLQLLVHTLERSGQREVAREIVQDLLARDPENRDYKLFELALEPPSEEKDEKRLELVAGIEDEKSRYLEYARFYREKNDIPKEREYLDKAESLDPTNAGIIESQFSAALRESNWTIAGKYAERFEALDIDGAGGKIAKGRLTLARGQAMHNDKNPDAPAKLLESIQLLRSGLDIYPSNSIGWTYLAQAYMLLGNQAQAKGVLERALEINPTNGHAARMRAQIAYDEDDDKSTRRYLAVAERELPDDDWCKRMRQVLQERENPMSGIPGRVEQRKKDPDDVPNLIMLAQLYSDPSVGEYEKAEAVYREALAKSPDDLGLLRRVANFFASENVNLPQEGESLLKQRMQDVEDNPTKALLAVSLAEFYATQNQYNTADRYYRLAISLDGSARILSLAADFYRKSKRYDESIAALEKLLQIKDLDIAFAQNAQSRKIAALLAMNELDRAKTEIDSYIADFPDDDQGMIYIGAWHRVAGDVKRAEEAFDRHLARDPDNAVALWQRGQLHMLQNKYQLAVQDLQRAKTVKPGAFGYQHRILLADAYVELGRFQDAIKELNDILKDDPTLDRIAKALIDTYMRVRPARYQEAEDLIYRYMRTYPRDYQWPMLLGQLGKISQDLNKRVTGYLKAAELSQNQPDPVRELFSALRSANDAPSIIAYATQKLTPTTLNRVPEAISDLAWAYHRTGDKDRCVESFKQSLSAAGDNFIRYNSIIGDMAQLLGPQEALAQMKAASDADSSNLLKRRALVHLYWINQNIPGAIEVCNQIEAAAVRDGDALFAHIAKGMLYNAQQNYTKSRDEYEAALSIDSNHPMLLNNLSFLLAESMNLPAEALPHAKKASRLQPNNPDILDTYGWIQAMNGQLGEAEGTLLRALDLDSKHIDVLVHLAKLHAKRGDCDDARRRLKYVNEVIEQRISQGEEQAVQRELPKIKEALEQVERDCGKSP